MKSILKVFQNPYSRASIILESGISFLLILSLSLLPLEFLEIENQNVTTSLLFLEKAIITVFVLEYFLRLNIAKKTLRFIFSLEGIIDLIVILPFFFEDSIAVFIPPFLIVLLRMLRFFKFFSILNHQQALHLHLIRKDLIKKLDVLEKENIITVFQKHPIVFVSEMFPPIFFLNIGTFSFLIFSNSFYIALGVFFICLVIAIMFFARAWINLRGDILILTNLRLILEDSNLFSSQKHSIRYRSITNIVPSKSGFWNTILNKGQVKIETATDSTHLCFTQALNPYALAQSVEEVRENRFIKDGSITKTETKAKTGNPV